MPSATAPAARNSAALAAVIPPVGSIFTWGSGPFSARRYLAPPTAEMGKIFTTSAPRFQAAITSVGVSAPGMAGTPRPWASMTVSGSRPGLTTNAAPASMHWCAAAAFSTVPAPTSARSPSSRTSARMTSGASGTVMVISKTEMPPAITARAARSARSGVAARITGTIPSSAIRRMISARGACSTCDVNSGGVIDRSARSGPPWRAAPRGARPSSCRRGSTWPARRAPRRSRAPTAGPCLRGARR